MESVLTGVIIFFLLLFAVFTLTGAAFESQQLLATTWEETTNHLSDQMNTQIKFVEAHFSTETETAELVYRNSGSARLSDFESWDVIAQYYDDDDPANYEIAWLTYDPVAADPNEWSKTIYLNVANEDEEVFDLDVLDPGEELVLTIRLDPTLGAGETLLVTVGTPNGITSGAQFTRNIPPELLTNAGLSLTSRTSADITSDLLEVTDEDGTPENLVYTVETELLQGNLNLGSTFTQADIDAGLLTYTHTGLGDDSFDFRVTDGDDEIGAFTFTITVTNAAPELAANGGLTIVASSSGAISAGQLSVSDVDNEPVDLVYTVVNPPAQGTLSLGGTFTQADINDGLLSYTHLGEGNDSFSVQVSDGEATTGLIWFSITVQ